MELLPDAADMRINNRRGKTCANMLKQTPVAYLGSQVVAGTNHAFLCQAVTVVPDAVPRWTVVFLYEDLQGNVSLMNIADFDFGALCTYGAEN